MIFKYDSIDAFLKDELRRRLSVNPRYSLRSFARNLQLSPGALSEILRGRRDLSLRSVPQIAKAIGLSAVEGRQLLRLAQMSKTSKDKGLRALEEQAEHREEQALSADVFALVSEWYHFAILNLLECEGFQWSAIWIARRLAVSRLQAQMAMELLLRLGMVVKSKGRYIGKSDHVVSSSPVPSAAIRKYHRQLLEKAILALETQGLAERDFSGCGLALDPAHLPAIKKELGQFQDHLIAKFSSGTKSEVYFLQVALFKLTQGSNP